MSVLKAHEVEPYLDRLRAPLPFCVMAFGPDRGLVSECIARFCAAAPVDASDPLATVTLDGPAVAADPGRLWDELNGPGLFGGGRLVRLREAGADKRIADVVKALLDDPPAGVHLAIEAGDIRRTTALVKAFDRAPSGTALPCYADDERTLERTITRLVSDGGLTIEPAAKAELLSTLGSDRRATRAEVEKLMLYAAGTDTITLDDVRAVIGEGASFSADEAVDATLAGDGARFERAYARLLASRVSPFLVLRDLAQQLQWIERAHHKAGGSGSGAARAVAALAGKRVHFKRMPALERGARDLDEMAVRRLGQRMADTVLQTRLSGDLEAEIVHALCTDVLNARPSRAGSTR